MIFSLHNVGVVFNEQLLFAPLSFEVSKGEKVAISGNSGKGKSTLFNLLLGFEQRFTGEILYEDKPLTPTVIQQFRMQVGWLPQELSFLSTLTVREFIFAPFEYHVNKANRPTVEEIEQWFDAFDLKTDLLNHSLNAISGGEKQRLGLITVLLLKRSILLLDEPVSALDVTTKQKVIERLFSDKNLTILSSSHDAIWNERCDKIITL
jgi:putative ABC transport system ATP-binding protein